MKILRKRNLTLMVALFSCITVIAQPVNRDFLDVLPLGNEIAEKAHSLTEDKSKIIQGGLNEPARILLPLDNPAWQGGKISFTMKVDPVRQNYITVKLWGSDVNHNLLNLICEGRQVGYRHLGDYELFDLGTDVPYFNGRFYYKTTPLPASLTKGKTEVRLEIRSTGLIWSYGQTFDQYQKKMESPTRGIYNLYIHTHTSFVMPANEKQGEVPAVAIRKGPGEEVLTALKQRINSTIESLLKSAKPLSQVQLQFLAKAWFVKWSDAYQNKQVVDKVLEGLDAIYFEYRKNPGLAEADPATWNAEWFGLGITGQVLYLLYEPLKDKLEKNISHPDYTSIVRREAFTEMLTVCRDWHTRHRRMYTNQSMINDLYGIYFANKGLEVINPGKASAEQNMLAYLYESMGLQPWLGSETGNGPNKSAGDNYMQLTKNGLTKELGYVGNYGEVLDWVTEIYEATRPSAGKPGNAKIKAQVEKIALARMWFRFPSVDSAGNRCMRMETIVGWRDTHYPGEVTYVQRSSWDGGPLQVVTSVMNPKLIGYAQQMFADNQFFSNVEERMRDKGFRVTAGLLPIPDQYELIKELPKADNKLPMTNGQPDFVFSDEEDGVVAIKNGKEVLYASLYWRARNAINNLAKVHFITPETDYVSTIFIEQQFEKSGLFYTRPDHTNFGFANGGLKYDDTTHSAHAGEQLPVAKIPGDVKYTTGAENPFAGRADFYKMEYGHYLIAMNASADKKFTLEVPESFAAAVELASKKKITGRQLEISSGTTIVLFKEK